MCLEGCELSVFCSCGFVSAAMAHVFYDVVAVCCAVLVSCAVVCDALCSALLLQSALDGLEPLSLGPIKFRTWHLRIRKNMRPRPQEYAGEDVWGGPAVLLAPGHARPTPARIFSHRSRTNTNPKAPCKARRSTRGERLRFLEPERRRTGPIGADREREPARNVPQGPPFRRRASLSDAFSRSGRISPGVLEPSQLCVDQLASVVPRLLASRRAKQHCTRPPHCSQLV